MCRTLVANVVTLVKVSRAVLTRPRFPSIQLGARLVDTRHAVWARYARGAVKDGLILSKATLETEVVVKSIPDATLAIRDVVGPRVGVARDGAIAADDIPALDLLRVLVL